MFLEALPGFLLLGAVSGFMAGLLGIGGGLILVPGLLWLFSAHGLASSQLMQLAVGTSLATIFFTALSSYRGHHRHGAVAGDTLLRMTPGLLIGGLVGAVVAGQLASDTLVAVFALFVFIVALLLLGDVQPRTARPLPGAIGLAGAGLLIASISAVLGIGGGTLTTPYLLWHRFELRRAIATSAACGVPIALAGAAGFLVAGLYGDISASPGWSTGFIYWPAVLGLSVSAVFMAPWGARLTHRLPVGLMRKLFALLLIAVAIHLLFD